MARKWSARVLALGLLTLSVGCKSTSCAPDVAPPLISTPLFPEAIAPPPMPMPIPMPASPGPSPALSPTAIPPSLSAAPISKPDPAPALLPKPDALPTPRVAEPMLVQVPSEPEAPSTGPALPDVVVPPQDVTARLTSNPKAEPPPAPPAPPAVKPLLVDAPRPAAGADGFAPAPRVPQVSPAAGEPPPVITRAVTPPPLPLRPGEKFGHAPDYRWVAGVLDRHARGGFWTIRYAEPDVDDEWGGKVRLMDDPRLREYRDGDVLYIEGELVASPKSAAGGLTYPPYRIAAIRRVGEPR